MPSIHGRWGSLNLFGIRFLVVFRKWAVRVSLHMKSCMPAALQSGSAAYSPLQEHVPPPGIQRGTARFWHHTCLSLFK